MYRESNSMLQNLAVPISKRQPLLIFFPAYIVFVAFVVLYVSVFGVFWFCLGGRLVFTSISLNEIFIFLTTGIIYLLLTIEDYDRALFTHPPGPQCT